MNYFDDENCASALKCYIPDDVKLQKEALIIFCTAMNDLLTNFVDAIVRNADKKREINTKMVRESIKSLFPDRLRKLAFANACRNVVLYHSELISFDEENIAVEPVSADYRNDIKRILKDFSFSAAREFMPHINGYLNDICHAIAEKSSRNANHNNRVLAEDCVLSGVGEILPGNLKNHAVARIHYLQQRLVLPTASSSKEPEPLFAENQIASVENESMDIEEVEHESPKNASFHGKACQLFKPVREKKQMVEKEYTPTKLTEEPEFLLARKEMVSAEKESLDTSEVILEGLTCAFPGDARQLFNFVIGESQMMEIEAISTKVFEEQKLLLAEKEMVPCEKESMNVEEIELGRHVSLQDKSFQLSDSVKEKSQIMEIEEIHTKVIEEQKFLLAEKEMVRDEKEPMNVEEIELGSSRHITLRDESRQLFDSVKEKSQMMEIEEIPTKVIEEQKFLLAEKEMVKDEKEPMNVEEIELVSSTHISLKDESRQLSDSVKGKSQMMEIEEIPTKVIEEQKLLLAEKEMVRDEKEPTNVEEIELVSSTHISLQDESRQLFDSVKGQSQTREIEKTFTEVIEQSEFLLARKEMVSDEKEPMNAEKVEYVITKRASFQDNAHHLFNSVKEQSQTIEIEEASTEFIEQSESLVDIDKINSLLDITSHLYYPIGVKSRTVENEENKIVKIDEMREEDTKSRYFLDVARQWLLPTDKSPAEETESESSISNKT